MRRFTSARATAGTAASPLPLALSRWLLTALLALAAAFSGPRAHADEFLDQQNAPAQWGGGAHHITVAAAQTVTPTMHCLTRVELGIMTGNRGKGGDTITLTVLDWNVNPPREIARVSDYVPEGFNGWLNFPMPGGGVDVTGAYLALQAKDTGKNVFWLKYQINNPYPGGRYYFGGAVNSNRDYLFRTYGRASCGSFALGVTPDPVTLTRGATAQATVSVTRMGGFTGPVNVSFSTPSGISALPPLLAIPASATSGNVVLSATASAALGNRVVNVSGTSGSTSASTHFHVNVLAAPVAPHINSVSPAAQVKNGTITLAGTDFDTNCAANSITVGSAITLPGAPGCTATSLSVAVPPQAPYGPTTIKVTSRGIASNAVAFSVARDIGDFVEITNDIVSHSTNETCSGGTNKLEFVSTGISSIDGQGYNATYRRVSSGAAIGSSIFFHADNTQQFGSIPEPWENIGGAGFSLCGTGIVYDAGGHQRGQLILRDLDAGTNFQASPYGIDFRVPRLPPQTSEDYLPRFFRSPDGTLLLVVAAAPQNGQGQGLATIFDKVPGGTVLKAIAIFDQYGLGNPTVTAKVQAGNKVMFQFGPSQAPVYVNIP